jgi:hypothetical protein
MIVVMILAYSRIRSAGVGRSDGLIGFGRGDMVLIVSGIVFAVDESEIDVISRPIELNCSEVFKNLQGLGFEKELEQLTLDF